MLNHHVTWCAQASKGTILLTIVALYVKCFFPWLNEAGMCTYVHTVVAYHIRMHW